ncbi:hypothetical protein H310_09913 [Aphanomyces invadans]|uniref:FYVE-type domain-containing protein n=1 Tax=Aphanomyces invadans TaxID=157072 RepID=A0A024TSW8_9STRA|nr:hypothetical protein H310_09913 [Aphanomyces invadans]ETV97104.1 hypothetical protein H310_09913 [Aphanomyces invadans]|eukprot:XP_008874350.1 hypothetical protein H310_09913 [Aphanomyces invadans]
MLSRVRSAVSTGSPSPAATVRAAPIQHTLGPTEKRTCYKYIQSRHQSALEFSSPAVVRDFVKTKNGVDVFESRLTWQDIRAVTRINGTVKDVMALLCANDTDTFAACQKTILGDEFVAAKVLDTCLSDAKHDSSHYHCGLKWLAIMVDSDQVQPKIFDVVFLDYTDVCHTTEKQWMGYRIVESIRVVGCPPLPGCTRASIRSEVYVVMDTSTRGVVEVTYAAHMDWKMPGKPKMDGLADAVIQRLTNMRIHCENERLKKLEIINPVDWVHNTARSKCAICDVAFHFILRKRHHCRMCGEVICRKCNTKIDVPIGLGAKQLRVRVCVHCLVKCRETQTELLQRPSAQPATRNREQTFLCPGC